MLINKIILTLIFAGIYSVANAQNLNALDENNGFQNYKFGMHKNDFPSCEYQTLGDTEKCVISRVHKISDINVSEVSLYFIDSKLARINVHFENGSVRTRLLKAIESAFGSPTGRENFPEYREFMDKYHEVPGSYDQFRPQVTKWQANKVTLKHIFRQPIGTIFQHESLLHLEFVLNNYDDLLNAFRSKKYTPNDF